MPNGVLKKNTCYSTCRPAAGQKYSLTLQPQRQVALATVQLQPEGRNTKLKATAACSFGEDGPKPKLVVDLTWSV